MSYSVFFAFSTGLTKPLYVRKGLHQRILNRISYSEKTLGLKRTPTYTPDGEPQRPGWHWRNPGTDITTTLGKHPKPIAPNNYSNVHAWEKQKEDMAYAVRLHNSDIEWFYDEFRKGTPRKPRKKSDQEKIELITPEQAQEFWGGLRMLDLPLDLWTRDHYADYIEHIGQVLLTGESLGTHLDCKLTHKQAAAILRLFDCEMGHLLGFNLRAEITLDEDRKSTGNIAFSDDGGYDWCSHCGPIDSECFFARVGKCARAKRGQCELKNEHPAEFED
jgi:hypothetical protein